MTSLSFGSVRSAYGYKQTSSRPKLRSAYTPTRDIHLPPPRSQRHAVRNVRPGEPGNGHTPRGLGVFGGPTRALFSSKTDDKNSPKIFRMKGTPRKIFGAKKRS